MARKKSASSAAVNFAFGMGRGVRVFGVESVARLDDGCGVDVADNGLEAAVIGLGVTIVGLGVAVAG